MLKKHLICFGFILLLIMYVNCGKEECPTGPDDEVNENPSFATDILPILTTNCALSGCHNSSAAGGLNLSQDQAYANIYNVKSQQQNDLYLIHPSTADSSYLVLKVQNQQSNGTSRMPPSGSLNTSEIQLIVNWVNSGALNN